MNQSYVNGMQARSLGKDSSGNPHQKDTSDWEEFQKGFDSMDRHIRTLISNAKEISDAVQKISTASTQQRQVRGRHEVQKVPEGTHKG